MEALFTLVPPEIFALCALITLGAGMVKGMVGFAMPMIMISLMGSLIAPELALAGLIVPTLVSNGWQALRQGVREALGSVRQFRLFMIVGGVALMISAQMVRVIPVPAMLILIGAPVTVFALLQLLGWRPHLPNGNTPALEAGVGAFAGTIGGFSGTWGPPTVLYLTALDTPKRDAVRIQGVMYGLGSIVLLFAHVGSGVMRAETLPLSLALTVPAVAGMALGFRLQDRIDQVLFRRATLVVLAVAGLNLLRRGMMG
jgi:uncharacterized membrane protein YfcA